MTGPASRRALLGGLAALPALTVPALAEPDPHVAYRAHLHAAFHDVWAARPLGDDAHYGSAEDVGCTLVHRRLWQLASDVLKLPVPRTLDGLGVVGLATIAELEGALYGIDQREALCPEGRAVALTRIVLAISGERLPDHFAGFGDEPDYLEREKARFSSAPGTLPAWAIEEAKRCA